MKKNNLLIVLTFLLFSIEISAQQATKQKEVLLIVYHHRVGDTLHSDEER
jgi:hypothetical protein